MEAQKQDGKNRKEYQIFRQNYVMKKLKGPRKRKSTLYLILYNCNTNNSYLYIVMLTLSLKYKNIQCNIIIWMALKELVQ